MAANAPKLAQPANAMADLRWELRKQVRATLELARQLSTVRLPGEVSQLKAVMVALICDDIDLACIWAAHARRFTSGRGISEQASVGPEIMRAWIQRWSGHPEVAASLTNLNHPWREAADRWYSRVPYRVQQCLNLGAPTDTCTTPVARSRVQGGGDTVFGRWC